VRDGTKCSVTEALSGCPHHDGARLVKVHLDGYDLRPALTGAGPWRRKEFIY